MMVALVTIPSRMGFMLRLIPVCAAVVVCVPGTAVAAKVKVWHQHTPAHFEKAQFKNAVISSEGALRLSRQLRPLANLNATRVWSVIEDRDGNLLVATGDEGRIFKVAPDGKVSIAFTSEDSQILCLAASADGTVYAGTGPGGLILRIAPNSAGEVLCKTGEAYVWSLAIDSAGQIFAGTGPKGKIYQVTREGQVRLFYSTKQQHILSLAIGPDGMVYAGADKEGLVYRIDVKGKGFVLYSAPQAEIRTLLAGADGVFVGTSSPSRRRIGSGGAMTTGRGPISQPLTFSPTSTAKERDSTGPGKETSTASGQSSSVSADSSEKGTGLSSASPSSGENSLYRIAADGTVREIFRERAMLLSLLRQNGRIFIGTGMEGQLFEVDENSKERSEIARLDHGQIHCLYRRRDGSIVIGTGDPGKLYVLEDRYAAQGTIVSEVLDTKLMSRWGSLRWTADVPTGTSVSVAVRSGNVAEPNETWSDWSPEQTDWQQAVILAPTARFLQYRVTLSSENPQLSPAVHSLALRYMTTNQAPEVTGIQVPDLDAVNLENPKKLHVKWTAADPNDDDLTYNLYIRKDGWKKWVQLEENLERTDFDWDTTTAPSGTYELRVVASDRKDNPAEEALTGERTSAPFVVAHTPPGVSLKTAGMDNDQAIIEAAATDPLVRLTAASFSLNGKSWTNVFPTNGLFDSKSASFRFKTEPLKAGSYVLVLRVRDAAGNTGTGDVVFTVREKSDQK
jgi:hypothetical protein